MRIHRMGRIVTFLAVALAVLAVATGASAASNTLRIDPASTSVAEGGNFTIKVIQNASVATSGVSATITFDRTKVQVTTLTRGAPWASAPLFVAGDAAAIAAANKSGKLKNVSAAFFPPGSVPAGDAEFITIEFKAVGCGQVKLGLPVGAVDGGMLDGRTNTFGSALKVTATGATVTLCSAGGSASPSLAPGETPAAQASGDVLGATSSADPMASGSPDPLASGSLESGSPDPAAETPPPAAGGYTPSAAPSPDPAAAGSTEQGRQDAWLTFAMAALAVAAAGLAALIALIVLAALITAVVGPILLVRYLRRNGQGTPPEPATTPEEAATDGAGPAGGETPTADDASTADGPAEAGVSTTDAGAPTTGEPDQGSPSPEQAAER